MRDLPNGDGVGEKLVREGREEERRDERDFPSGKTLRQRRGEAVRERNRRFGGSPVWLLEYSPIDRYDQRDSGDHRSPLESFQSHSHVGTAS